MRGLLRPYKAHRFPFLPVPVLARYSPVGFWQRDPSGRAPGANRAIAVEAVDCSGKGAQLPSPASVSSSGQRPFAARPGKVPVNLLVACDSSGGREALATRAPVRLAPHGKGPN